MVAVQAFGDLRDDLQDAASGKVEVRKALLACGHAYVSYALEQPFLFALLSGGTVPEIDDHPAVENARAQTRDVLLNVVALVDGNAEDIVDSAWACAHGLALLATSGAMRPAPDDARILQILASHLDGLPRPT